VKYFVLTLTLVLLSSLAFAQVDPPFNDDETLLLRIGREVFQERAQLQKKRTENGELVATIAAVDARLVTLQALSDGAFSRARTKAKLAIDTAIARLTRHRDNLQAQLDDYVDPSSRILLLNGVLSELEDELLLIAPVGRLRQHYIDFVKS
jgi:hypothetical protein